MSRTQSVARQRLVFALTTLLPSVFVAAACAVPSATIASPLQQLAAQKRIQVTGQVIDRSNGQGMPARLYLTDASGKNLLVDARDANTPAFQYNVDRGASREIHTAVPASGFRTLLPPGTYELLVERGKEYLPVSKTIEVKDQPIDVKIELDRWIHMAELGWYSGDTHIHLDWSSVALPLSAEDLNVGMPISYWATDTSHTPLKNNRAAGVAPPAKLIKIEPNRVIWPINTEYEIFTVDQKRHTLGAFFVINHRDPLDLALPPIGPVITEARRQKALLDFDKHNWPWSMMLMPVANIDLFELSNNHIWRTPFLFGDWYPEYTAPYMNVEKDADGKMTEQGWIDFGFETYYSILNCGFKMKPTAGTAVGVHPVPMGFGRVYVHLEEPFSYDAWIAGLAKGQSFVSTGPMLRATFNGLLPGASFDWKTADELKVSGQLDSQFPIDRIEAVVNGEVVESWTPESRTLENGCYTATFDKSLTISETSWVALRCHEKRPDQRPRFAHTAPVWVSINDQPLRARRVEVEYMVDRVRSEIQRHRGVLTPAAIAEYETALEYYESLLETSR